MAGRIFYFIPWMLCCLVVLLPALQAQETNWELTLVNNFPKSTVPVITIINAVAIDIDFAANIYIVDRGRHQLFKFMGDGQLLKQVGGFGNADEQFDDPRDVDATNTLDIYVADYNNNRVVRYDQNLNFLNTFESQWPEPYDFQQVLSAAVSSQNDLFLLEDGAKRINKFDRFSRPAASFGGIYEYFGQLLEPQQISLGGSKRLFVSDPGQSAIVVFDYLGNFVGNIKHPGLEEPAGIHWGQDQQLYAVNRETADIYIFSEKLKFVGIITLKNYVEEIVDIAVWHNLETRQTLLYALAPTRCWVFDVKKKTR